jgi:hypothetical protein
MKAPNADILQDASICRYWTVGGGIRLDAQENRPCLSFVSTFARARTRPTVRRGRVVYDALVSVGVPKNDRFQVIGEHEADSFLFDPDYLGIHRSDDLVIIQITWNEGRSVDQK